MFSFLTNDNNDLYLTSADSGGKASKSSVLVSADGAEALRQEIVNKVRLQRGEYGYNLNRGVDYMNLLLTDTPLIRIWEEQVLEIIRNMEDVKNIVYWNYGLKGNNFMFRLTIDSTYGRIEIKG